MGLIIEVYRRAGITVADPLKDPDKAEAEWYEVEDWEPGDVLGIEDQVAGFVGHSALYLGWGLVFNSEQSTGAKVVPLAQLSRRVMTVFRHVDADRKI